MLTSDVASSLALVVNNPRHWVWSSQAQNILYHWCNLNPSSEVCKYSMAWKLSSCKQDNYTMTSFCSLSLLSYYFRAFIRDVTLAHTSLSMQLCNYFVGENVSVLSEPIRSSDPYKQCLDCSVGTETNYLYLGNWKSLGCWFERDRREGEAAEDSCKYELSKSNSLCHHYWNNND